MKRSTTAVIVGVLALGLVGGGTAVALTGQDDPTPAETSLSEPTATPDTGQPDTDETPTDDATEPLTAETPATDADPDAMFIDEARDRLSGLGAATTIPNATDAQLMAGGHEACESMADGTAFSDVTVIEGEPRTQGSYLDSAAIASAGLLFYCPELNGKVGR